MTGWFHTHRAALLFAAFVLLSTGCQTAMSDPTGHATAHATSSMFPLKFKLHNFQAFCFNTLRCQVIYNEFDFTPYKADEQPSGPSKSPDYREHWGGASYLGVGNFPPPAEVRWTALDGSTHEATVDIGAIFKDERVLYRVPDEEIVDRSWGSDADIFLEVNDRTLNVYMSAFIDTKTEQIPGNKYSYHRRDVILAWTHTY